MPNIPQSAWEAIQKGKQMASMLRVPHAPRVGDDGLYVATRKRRDPINTNRKRTYMTVRFKRGGVEVFRSDEECKGFPSKHLIAQLMLIT